MREKRSQVQRVGSAATLIIAIATAYIFGQHHPPVKAATSTRRPVLYYTDPMHPAYKSDKPGIAPDCGMPLEPVYAEDVVKTAASPALPKSATDSVNIDGATQRLLGIRVATAEKSTTTRVIRAVGRVVPEDTLIYKVNSGVDGFIRQTYGDSVGLLVRKDQKLATYYAPDFLAAASGFLAANERVPGSVTKEGTRSIQNYTDRLRNLGMSDVQIKNMVETHQLPETIDVIAPASGFILARYISPGQHFTHDMNFYLIADLSRVWVSAEVDEQEAQYVRPGGTARLTLRDEGRQWTARITDSLPQSEAGGGSVKLRLEADNSKFVLRPDMLVDVELPVRLIGSVTVPLDALIDSGEHKRVYVQRDNDTFEPREVVTGWSFGERVQILQGVQPGERVVASATFLIDSEDRLKAPEALIPGTHGTGRPAPVGAPGAEPKTVKDNRLDAPKDPEGKTASTAALVLASRVGEGKR